MAKNKPSEDQKRALRGYLDELGKIIEEVKKLTEKTLNTSPDLGRKVLKIYYAICDMRIEQDVTGHLNTVFTLLNTAPGIVSNKGFMSTLPGIIQAVEGLWEQEAKPKLEKLVS